ncbi:MAG: hypothetical protein L0221_06745 [Chloroflexi bacterium]|nr:hypothetical protein [Chloroflexota bacterium]
MTSSQTPAAVPPFDSAALGSLLGSALAAPSEGAMLSVPADAGADAAVDGEPPPPQAASVRAARTSETDIRTNARMW